MANFVSKFKNTNEKLMTELDDPAQVLDLTTNIAYEYFSSFNSMYKRNKIFSSSSQFVTPVEKAIGTRWELKKISTIQNRVIRIPKQIQSVLSYVSILQTLKSLFSCEEFTSLYFDYNLKNRTNECSQKTSFFKCILIVCNCKSQQMIMTPAIHSNPKLVDIKYVAFT